MISIRIRVVLLAVVGLVAVTTLFSLEYISTRRKLESAQDTLRSTGDVRILSELINSLQKERRLAARGSIQERHEFLEQTQTSQMLWAKLSSSHRLRQHRFAESFPAQMLFMHEQIARGSVTWQHARTFYSSALQGLLQLMVLELVSLDYSQGILYELQSLPHLADSREHFGQLQVIMARAHQQRRLSAADATLLSSCRGIFLDSLNSFEAISAAHVEQTADAAWKAQIRTETFQSLMRRVEVALTIPAEWPEGLARDWWRDSSLVVDRMRKTEDAILGQIETHMSEDIDYFQGYLFWYGLLASLALTAVALLTASTVLRIFKVLSILRRDLGRVEESQDFGFRFDATSNDEFAQLSRSLNGLLSYTQALINEMKLMATTDSLTGTMNRRSFIEVAQSEIKRSERYGAALSLIYCDIDFFKSINDEHGHAAGDDVLEKFSKVLKESVRTNDHVGRWGGEEFVVLAPETDLESAVALAEKLRQRFVESSFAPVAQVTCSFGVAQRRPGESFSDLGERADSALYAAKRGGRNKVQFAD